MPYIRHAAGAFHACRNCGEGCEQGGRAAGFGLIDENPRQGCPISSTRADCGVADDGHGDPARAEREGGLFDALFGGGIRYKPRNVDPRKVLPRMRRVPRKAVAAPKVTGPSYYNYKADPLVRVDFAALARRAGKGHVRAVARRPIDQRSRGRPGRLRPVCREGYRARRSPTITAANPQFIWVTGPDRQREGRRRRSACSAPPTATGCRRPTMPSPFRPRPPMAAMRAARMAELVRFEMTLSARVLRYVRDAQTGRIDPNRISGYHDFPEKTFDAMTRAEDAGAYRRGADLPGIAASAEPGIPGAARRIGSAEGERGKRDRRRPEASPEARRDQRRIAEAPADHRARPR